MVKYCVANECPIDAEACANAAQRSSRGTQILTRRSQSALGFEHCLWRLKMVISTYSNILLSVSMINMTRCVCVCSQERPLGLFEVLARNRQSAVGLLGRTRSAREQPTECVQYLLDNNCPLPPGWRYEHGTLYDSEDEEIH